MSNLGRCLVLGGGGFLGATVVDRLLEEGCSVRVFERPRVTPYRVFRPDESVEWVTGDVVSAHDVGAAMERVDSVIHLVSTTLPKGSNDDPIYDVQSNLVGTLQILNLMVKQGVSRLVFVSSGGTIYGTPQRLPIDEAHPTDPQVSYGITKLAIEKYIALYRRMHGLSTCILRLSNPYGERQRVETAQGAVAVFLHRALRGEPIEIWGDGSVTRDYVYVRDVADAFLAAVRYAGDEAVFNIGSGRGTSLNELLTIIEATLGRAVERRYLSGRPFDVKTNVLDGTLAARELGWTAHTSIEEGVARTAAWLKASMQRS